jgi:CheY-like chemotaxis protein
MPEIDGYEAARAIRARRPAIRIVGLSANVQFDNRERCLAAGMDECLSKPVNWESLHAKMRGPLGGDAPDPAAARVSPQSAPDGPLDLLRARIGVESLSHLLRLFEIEAGPAFDGIASDGEVRQKFCGEAHSLAGSAGLLGLEPLEAACRALEAAIAANQEIEPELAMCRRERDAALRIVRAELAAWTAPSSTEIKSTPEQASRSVSG